MVKRDGKHACEIFITTGNKPAFKRQIQNKKIENQTANCKSS
jgi:hypothetical protein